MLAIPRKTDVVTVGYLEIALEKAFEKFAIQVQAGFKDVIDRMDRRFAEMDERFAGVDLELVEIKDELGRMNANLFSHDNRISNLEDKVRVVNTKLGL